MKHSTQDFKQSAQRRLSTAPRKAAAVRTAGKSQTGAALVRRVASMTVMPACMGATPRRRKPNIRSVAPGPAAWETPNEALHSPRVSRRRQQFRAYAVICANGLLLTAL